MGATSRELGTEIVFIRLCRQQGKVAQQYSITLSGHNSVCGATVQSFDLEVRMPKPTRIDVAFPLTCTLIGAVGR
jgi:hypothetical protein